MVARAPLPRKAEALYDDHCAARRRGWLGLGFGTKRRQSLFIPCGTSALRRRAIHVAKTRFSYCGCGRFRPWPRQRCNDRTGCRRHAGSVFGRGKRPSRPRLWRLWALWTQRPVWRVSRRRPMGRISLGTALPARLPPWSLRKALLAELTRSAPGAKAQCKSAAPVLSGARRFPARLETDGPPMAEPPGCGAAPGV